MSQQKVDNRKKEKYNRKAAPKKAQIKTILGYVAIALIGIAILVYLGYSIAVSTGMYTPPETTTTYASEVSASEQESGKSYEVSKDTSSSSSTKGDMPISLIICVVVMVLIFGYGYYKRKNEE